MSNADVMGSPVGFVCQGIVMYFVLSDVLIWSDLSCHAVLMLGTAVQVLNSTEGAYRLLLLLLHCGNCTGQHRGLLSLLVATVT